MVESVIMMMLVSVLLVPGTTSSIYSQPAFFPDATCYRSLSKNSNLFPLRYCCPRQSKYLNLSALYNTANSAPTEPWTPNYCQQWPNIGPHSIKGTTLRTTMHITAIRKHRAAVSIRLDTQQRWSPISESLDAYLGYSTGKRSHLGIVIKGESKASWRTSRNSREDRETWFIFNSRWNPSFGT